MPIERAFTGGSSRRVLVTWPDYDLADASTGARLTAAGLEVRLEPKTGGRAPHEVLALVRDACAAIVSTDPFDGEVFAAAPDLRVIARVGVGTDSIDLDAATASGVAVCTTPGANAVSTADHTVALMLAALRRVVEHDRSVRAGDWPRGADAQAWELSATTVGLIGYGTIGRMVADRLRGFGVRLLVCDPAVTAVDGVERVAMDRLLAEADLVSLHAPLTASTTHLLDATRLAAMQPHAVLVNTSRGGLVDEAALADALAGGRLRAAALDVYETEPPESRRLHDLPNTVLTPHLGGVSERSVAEMTRRATEAVLAVLNRRVPDGLVNSEVLAATGGSA